MQEVKRHLDGSSLLYQVEHRVRCKDGCYRWILARGKAVRDADGKATRFLGSHSDIDERVAAETRLRLRTAQLNAIFALSPDGFVAFGEKDSIEYVSAAFTDLTGLAAHEVIGLSEEGLIDRLGALCIADSRGNQLALEKLRSPVDDVDQAHGRNLLDLAGPALLTIEVGRRRSSGQNVSKIFFVRDVTHETEVDRMKSEFLSTAAHELRTPMVSILGFSELLLNNVDYDQETVTELVETIHRQSKLMAAIINELLDLARIEARRGQDFEIESLDLNVLIREAVQSFLVPEDNRVPVVHLPAFPAETQGDRRKITQAVLNVLSNAFKYSPLGGEISIDLQPKFRIGRAGFNIDVRDHGVGMTPESVARVCERFFRADTSGSILGTGLGMSIVKEIIELHGGALDVSSTLGEGSLVSLWLPESASVEKEVSA
jgi:PAS domain S-box-containing protein